MEETAYLEEAQRRSPAPRSTFKVEMLSGMLSGAVCTLIFYAFESTEARMQVSTMQGKKGQLPPSMTQTFKSVVAREGYRGLFKGLSPTLMGSGANWGLYFSIYHVTRTYLAERKGVVHAGAPPPNMANDLLAGVVSGTVTSLLVNPFWVLKLRMITATPVSYPSSTTTMRYHPSLVGEAASLWRSEGLPGFWRGIGPSLLGVSEGAIQFMIYDQIKGYMSNGTGVTGPGTHIFAGGASKIVATLLTYPYQLIRSTLQANNCPYNGMSDAVKQIVKAEGMRGLYKGMTVNLIRQVPPSAFVFLFVEQLRLLFIAHMLQ